MDPRLAESWVNRDNHVVLGRRLHPFCLYDVFLLTVDENPLVLKQKSSTRADLRQAVLICSTPPEVFLSARRPMSRLAYRFWLMRTAWSNFLEASVRLITYMEDYDARPIFWRDEDGASDSLKAPWILSIASFLEDHSNMTEREIMTAPIGKMLWKSAAIAEYMGLSKDEIMSEGDEMAIRELGLDVS